MPTITLLKWFSNSALLRYIYHQVYKMIKGASKRMPAARILFTESWNEKSHHTCSMRHRRGKQHSGYTPENTTNAFTPTNYFHPAKIFQVGGITTSLAQRSTSITETSYRPRDSVLPLIFLKEWVYIRGIISWMS